MILAWDMLPVARFATSCRKMSTHLHLIFDWARDNALLRVGSGNVHATFQVLLQAPAARIRRNDQAGTRLIIVDALGLNHVRV